MSDSEDFDPHQGSATVPHIDVDGLDIIQDGGADDQRTAVRPAINHQQSTFLREFVDPDTEARYVEYRFGPASLIVTCVLCYVFGSLLLVPNVADLTVDVLRSPLKTWFFYNYNWLNSERIFGFVFFFVTAALFLTVPTVVLLYNKFVRQNAPVPGKYLEMYYVFMAFIFESHHCFFDLRYTVYCEPGVVSVLLRDPAKPDKCDDFVELYISMTLLSAFMLAPRLRYIVCFVLPWLPTPFLLRTTLFNFDSLFRTSDGVWFFMCLVYIISFVANEHVYRRQFIQHEIVTNEIEEAQRAQSVVRRLLDAMLPVSVLKRLIANEPVADCGEVSMVFSDVAGFTSWCSAQKAEDVVRMLNTMYNHFDNGLAYYDIEKIKTIGDAYWAVCGLPDHNPHHILHICSFATYMQRCVDQMGEENSQYELQIRVGVHAGQVCGGLVGKQQSTYDMFGTSNEVAEVMEQRAPIGGILLSEPAYKELKKSFSEDAENPLSMEGNDNNFTVELQDASVETLQGTMASYVLKSFSWMPPLLHIAQNSTLDVEFTPVTTPRVSEQMLAARALLKKAADDTPRSDQGTTPMNSPSERNGESESESPVRQSASESRATKSASVEIQALAEQQEKLFESSHRFHRTFDNENVEAQFQAFVHTLLPAKMQIVSSTHGLVGLIIYIVLLAEGREHPWYIHMLMVANLVTITIQYFLSSRITLHPLIGVAAVYVECNAMLFTLLATNRSAVSNDLVYLTLYFVLLLSPLGYVGSAPYLYILAAHFTFLTLPTLVIMLIMKSIYLAHSQIPIICVVVWGIALRRSEIGQRQQFKNKMLADTALRQTQAQHERASELLSRMVPSFIVEELTVWVCGTRDTMIAHNFPMVGILFTRFPTLRNQFSDSSVDPLTVMRLIGRYVNRCDNVVRKFPQCTKLKIIGDVQLFASGLVAVPTTDLSSNPLVSPQDDCSVESLSDTSSCDGDAPPPMENDPATPRRQHLTSLAHLAIALSKEIETRFDGAKISAGMHCGGATAGVIGNDRLIYDVFGDTVNIASRVMSTSGEGVWGSAKFCSKVSTVPHHGLFLGKRVERQMKGKGTMHVKSIAALPQ